MVCPRCVSSVEQLLEKNNLQAKYVRLGEVELSERPGKAQLERFAQDLKGTGFELLDDQKTQLIEQVKNLLIQKVQIRDILFVEGMKNYVQIQTNKEKILTLLSFAKLEELLPGQNFVRVHRSFVVALDKIEHIEKNRIRIGGQDIPISDTYAEAFFKRLGGFPEQP